MNSPSLRARSLLERYKASEALPAASKARILAKLMHAAAQGTPPRFDLREPIANREGSWLHDVWRKPLGRGIVIALVAVPALAVAALAGRSDEPRATLREAPTAWLSPPPAPSQELPLATPAPLPSAEAEAAPRRSLKVAPASKALRSAATREPSEPTIDGEMRLLKDAQAANLAGDSRRALALLDDYAQRFPAGRLKDVGTVARLVALCNLGQVSLARREAERFQTRYPNSPFRDRVSRICVPKAAP